MRIVFIVLASGAISFVLSYSLLGNILETNMSAKETQTRMFAELLLLDVNASELVKIKEPEDYGGESFQKVKETLDAHVRDSYDREEYFYYLIYRRDGQNIDVIMEYEDRYPCWYPGYLYGDEPYTEVLEGGSPTISTEISAYGAWSFVLMPIKDDEGNTVAELEVGQNLDYIQKEQDQLRMEMFIAIVISTVVITMLLLELSFLMQVLGQKDKNLLDPTDRIPVRTLMFFSYLADSMQDAFIAVLLSKLYDNILPISKGVAVALPMSLQLLAMAVFSIIGGKLTDRLGVRNGLLIGFVAEMAGCVICVATGNYMGILVGKLFIGAGQGTIYVACNTVSSMGGDSEHVEKSFANVSAGLLSGITIGAGLSSVLLPLGGWHLIYIIGAVILALGVFVVLSTTPKKLVSARNVETETKEEESSTGASVVWFLSRKRIIGFFLFLLIPFMMGLSFREYLFPLFASENGMTEVRIGQIYLACGLLGIYIGPVMSKWLLRTYGAKKCVMLASGLLVIDMALFAVWPTMSIIIAGVIILSFITSFAYTCQYSYFDTLDEIRTYGNSAALGIYSMMESVGQTLGPIVYGALLALGYQMGIMAFSVIMFSALVLFFILSVGKRNKKGA